MTPTYLEVLKAQACNAFHMFALFIIALFFAGFVVTIFIVWKTQLWQVFTDCIVEKQPQEKENQKETLIVMPKRTIEISISCEEGSEELFPFYSEICQIIQDVMEEGSRKYPKENWQERGYMEHFVHCREHLRNWINNNEECDEYYESEATHAFTRLALFLAIVQNWIAPANAESFYHYADDDPASPFNDIVLDSTALDGNLPVEPTVGEGKFILASRELKKPDSDISGDAGAKSGAGNPEGDAS